MRITEGKASSHSIIKCIQQTTQQALFELTPITGKTHQLRVKMQLLAKELKFIDPITQQPRHFQYDGNLSLL